MGNSVKRFHLEYIGRHVNQTCLVSELLYRGIISCDEVYGVGDETEVYQWLIFNNLRELDYERLEKAGIPHIDSELGAWVGITSFGSHYDLYVYPELIRAVFEIPCTYEDILKAQNASA